MGLGLGVRLGEQCNGRCGCLGGECGTGCSLTGWCVFGFGLCGRWWAMWGWL